jgi:hypothetical protein
MSATLKNNRFNRTAINGWYNNISGSRGNLALDAAYVHGVSGDAIAVRYSCPTADPINELYVFLDANGGTLGNITMACDIYNEHATTISQPGSTLRNSSTATVMPDAVDKWIKFTFGTPYTPSVGEIIWLIIRNTSASPTVDFPQLMTTNTVILGRPAGWGWTECYQTGVGFSSAGASLSQEMPFIVKQGIKYFGHPYTQITASYHASNMLKRGIVFTITGSVKIFGVEFTGIVAYSGFEIFDNATGPGGVPLHTFALGSDANQSRDEVIGAKIFNLPITLPAGTYKAVLTFAATSPQPYTAQIEDYASYSSVFDELADGFNVCHGCIDNGAGGWTIEKNATKAIMLLIDEFVASSGSSGQRSYAL